MAKFRRVSPREADELMRQGYTYLDVRTEAEFAEGHPEGAFNVPFLRAGAGGMEGNPDFLSVVRAHFAEDAKLIVGCKAGGRSLRAAEALTQAGYEDVLDQRAGWDGTKDAFGQPEPGWSRVDLPTERGEPEGRAYASLVGK